MPSWRIISSKFGLSLRMAGVSVQDVFCLFGAVGRFMLGWMLTSAFVIPRNLQSHLDKALKRDRKLEDVIETNKATTS